MSDYTKSTNFASKDSLSSGNPLKIVKGTEIDTELNNIATAVATKADLNSPTFIGTPVAPTASAGTSNTQLATTAFVVAERSATATLINKSLTSPTLTGTPVAPTASVDTNTTQVATTAFVVAQIADDAPTKTGTGASGTWNITANAVTNITTSQVLNATAGASAGGVGTYVFAAKDYLSGDMSFGDTCSGSLLQPAAARLAGGVATSGTYLSGTWRCLGFISGTYISSLFLRIS